MEVWAELTESNATAHSGIVSAATAGPRTTGTLFQNMSGMGGVSGQALAAANVEKMFIPLQFWFCRNPGLALPLIALQYHEVKVMLTFGASADVASAVATSSPLSCSLWADYIYLDTDERRRFAQVSHEYLIEQLQFSDSTSATKNHELTFNHPVKELIWTGGVSDGALAAGPSTPKVVSTGDKYKLVLNGHDRFAARDYRYFTQTQVWQHHTGCGGIALTGDGSQAVHADSIAVYSFALKPEEHQPSGTCNFSRIDNAKLVCTANESLYIYAVNYNVLRVMSGMGGLAYSN
jgi:hypothetical protein